MLDLPKSTYFDKIIAKDKIYARAGVGNDLKNVFIEQVERIRWLNKISPATINIMHGEKVEEIQVIEISLATSAPDKRIMPTILKGIPYKIIFALVFEGKATYTVYYDNKTCFTSETPPKLIGSDTDSLWENIVIQISEIIIEKDKTLAEQIADNIERDRIIGLIDRLEKQARSEKQPRKKWELAEEVKKLKKELEVILNAI